MKLNASHNKCDPLSLLLCRISHAWQHRKEGSTGERGGWMESTLNQKYVVKVNALRVADATPECTVASLLQSPPTMQNSGRF